MENEDRRRVTALSSHNIGELRTFLNEKAKEPVPQPASYMIGGVVRTVFPELCELRKRGYTLNMLVRVFAENGIRITSTALSGYMKKLSREAEGIPATAGRKGRSLPSTSASKTCGHFAMKPDVTL